VDLSALLYRPVTDESVGLRYSQPQQHNLQKSLDQKILLELCQPAIERGEKVELDVPIRNVHRVTGSQVGSAVTRKYGLEGLPEDTIHMHFHGSAGLSFGAFIPRGVTMELEGDSNDYIGKGLSGGRIIVYPPKGSPFVPEENIIIGNVAFYGATSGEIFISGLAGERFCVRNSGANAVVEGIGDHGCEYMTGGRVVVLGKTGRNFAAGMSGGIAYVIDWDGSFHTRCNHEMANIEKIQDAAEIKEVKEMIQKHKQLTGSAFASRILEDWQAILPKIVKIIPMDYQRMLQAFAEVKAAGLSGDAAVKAAFELNSHELSRVSGN